MEGTMNTQEKRIVNLDSYVGDVDVQYGGYWVSVNDIDYGYADCVDVIDLDGAGIANTLLIIDGSVWIPEDVEYRMRALRTIGQFSMPDLTTDRGKRILIDACHASWGTEPRGDFISTGYTEVYIPFFDDDPIPDGPQFEIHADFHVLDQDVDLEQWIDDHFHIRDRFG